MEHRQAACSWQQEEEGGLNSVDEYLMWVWTIDYQQARGHMTRSLTMLISFFIVQTYSIFKSFMNHSPGLCALIIYLFTLALVTSKYRILLNLKIRKERGRKLLELMLFLNIISWLWQQQTAGLLIYSFITCTLPNPLDLHQVLQSHPWQHKHAFMCLSLLLWGLNLLK